MKKFYMIAFMVCATMGAMAQHNHGVNIQVEQDLFPTEHASGFTCRMEVIYFPKYVQAQSSEIMGTGIVGEEDKTLVQHINEALTNGSVDGLFLNSQVTVDQDGLAYVVVPDQAYIGGELTKVDGGDIRFRIAYEKGGVRPGDKSDFYVYDTKSLYATVSAPAGTQINGYIVAANCSTFLDKENGHGDDANGKYWHTASFDFAPLTIANVPTDLATVGEAYGSTNLFTFRRVAGKKGLDNCDSAGFPCKNFDVVFRNLKAGDKVGLTNYQTVCPDYTPQPYQGGAGVSEVIVDENAPVEYFNLQGMRVANPENGLYIVRQGSKTTKVFVK